MLKSVEAEWRAKADAAVAAMTARCEEAEAALAAVDKPGVQSERDEEIAHLRQEMTRQSEIAETALAEARAAADAAAGEKLKAAQIVWERETANSLAAAKSRAEKAEAALAAEQRTGQDRGVHSDEYVHSLEREVKTLRATLVDREAAIVGAQAMQEHVRLGTVRDTPGTRWQPLPTGGDEEPVRDTQKTKANRVLLRDIGAVVAAAVVAVLLLPKLEGMLPDTIRWQIETMGGLFIPSEPVTAAAPGPAPAASTQPKAAHPLRYATRSINVRAEPSTSGAVLANLKKGASLSLLEERGSWSRVEVSSSQGARAVEGWVFATYLTDSDPGTATPAAAPARTAAASASTTAPAAASVAAPAPAAAEAPTPSAPAEAASTP